MRAQLIRCLWLLSALLVVLSSGCAKPIKPDGHLVGGYESFEWRDSPELKVRLYSEPDLTFRPLLLTRDEAKRRQREGLAVPTPTMYQLDVTTSQPLLLVVDPPEWASELRLDEEVEEKMLFTLRERLYRYSLRQYPDPVRVRYAWTPKDTGFAGYRVIHLRTRVTDFNLGNGWARYLLGFGAGSSEVQIEGELVERVPEEDLLGEFVIREGHGGYAQWGINVKVFSGTYCLKYAIEEAVDKLMKSLPDMLPGARVRPDLHPPDPRLQMASGIPGLR